MLPQAQVYSPHYAFYVSSVRFVPRFLSLHLYRSTRRWWAQAAEVMQTSY